MSCALGTGPRRCLLDNMIPLDREHTVRHLARRCQPGTGRQRRPASSTPPIAREVPQSQHETTTAHDTSCCQRQAPPSADCAVLHQLSDRAIRVACTPSFTTPQERLLSERARLMIQKHCPQSSPFARRRRLTFPPQQPLRPFGSRLAPHLIDLRTVVHQPRLGGAVGRLFFLQLAIRAASPFSPAKFATAPAHAHSLSVRACAAAMPPYLPPASLRGVFAGAGSDGLAEPAVADAVIKLTGKSAADVTVLYLGTATYDLPGPRDRQTARFRDARCKVVSVDIALKEPPLEEVAAAIAQADAIIFSGGNTLYAVDRCTRFGMLPALQAAMARGVVLAGGSAGAICWFDGGHSDSMDPDSYKEAMLAAAKKDIGGDESTAAPTDEASEKVRPLPPPPCRRAACPRSARGNEELKGPPAPLGRRGAAGVGVHQGRGLRPPSGDTLPASRQGPPPCPSTPTRRAPRAPPRPSAPTRE